MRIIATVLALLCAPAAAQPLLYEIRDDDNVVWLLGSVHALRANEYPLDARIEAAFEAAERIVLEVPPAELTPEHLGPLTLALARDENRAISEVFTESERERLRRGLSALAVDADQLQSFEPWFVALQAYAINLARAGFTAIEGVDAHYAARAAEAGKATDGLETAREQIALFDQLPLELQKRFLLETLEEADGFRAEMERLVALWRAGDADALEALLAAEFADAPELKDALLDARNRRWIAPIEALVAGDDDALVIVGALHLVGEDGVVRLLEKKGYEVRRSEGETR